MKKLFPTIIIAVFLVLTLSQINKLPRADEAMYYRTMKSLAENNTIIEYKGEGRLPVDELEGYVHMPLYVWISSAFLKIFGVSVPVARLVPILFGIGNLFLVWLILGLLAKDYYKKVVLLALLAVHPLFVQNSVLLDIDGGVLCFFLLLTTYFYFKNWQRLYIIALSLSFFSKLTTPFLLIIAFILYEWLSQKKDLAKTTVLHGLCGLLALVFAFVYNLFFAGLHSLYPIIPYERWLNSVVGPGITNVSKVITMGINTISLVTWFNIIFLILIWYLGFKRVQNCLKTRKLQNADFFVLLGAIVFVFYWELFPITFGFPKYYQIALVGFVVGLSALSFRKLKNPFRNWYGLVAAVLFVILFWRDKVLEQVIYLENPLSIILGRLVSFVLITFFVAYGFSQRQKVTDFIVPFAITTFLVVDIFVILNPNVGYFYGEEGYETTINYIKTYTTKNDVIISPHDIAYNSKRKFYSFEGYDNQKRVGIFHEDFTRNDWKYLVLRKKFYRYHPELKEFLDDNTNCISIGGFDICKKRKKSWSA